MNRAIEWFAGNHVAANLLMFVIIGAGILSVPHLKQTIWPDFQIDYISVTVVYPGASPEDVEKSITLAIEEAIQEVDGIEEITSSANEGATNITIEVADGQDLARVLGEIETRVDSITTFPEEAEDPLVRQLVWRSQVLDIAIHGDADERTLKNLGQEIRDEIAGLPGISQAEVSSVRPYEISIEVSEAALQRHGLRFEDVVLAVRRYSLDVPGGSVKTRGGEILLRTEGQAYWGHEFERIPLVTREDGSRLVVGDVATVVDGFEEIDSFARFDGEPAVFVQVHRVGQQQALEVAARVREYLDGKRAAMPEGVKLTVWDDDSKHLQDRLGMMTANASYGFVLVLLLLAIFLKLRVAFWVAMGVPVSVAGALALMGPMGLGINVLTLFSFIMALGILVDDAIVTGENVYTHQERNPSNPLAASIRGTQEVATPVVFGVLTTVAAFLPFTFVGGNARFMAMGISGVMIAALLVSLVESKFVLPSHLAHWSGVGTRPRHRISIRWAAFQARVSEQLRSFVDNVYAPAVRACIEWRYLTATVSIAIFALCLGIVRSGHVRSVMSPPMELDTIWAQVTMPLGTPAAETAEAIRQLEDAAAVLDEEYESQRAEGEPSLVQHTLGVVGHHRGQGRGRPSAGTHRGQLTLELSPGELRRIEGPAVAARWRELTGPIPGAEEVRFVGRRDHWGSPIDVELRGIDIDELRAVSAQVAEALEHYPGVYDIRDSFHEGKEQLKLSILPDAEALGLTLEDVGRQVRHAFYGAEVQRLQRGRDEVKVMVRYPAEERRSLADVENMRIRLSDGTAVPFRSVAEVERTRGPSSITRRNRYRTVNVTADIDFRAANAFEVNRDLETRVLPPLLEAHPGVRYSLEGEQRNSREAYSGIRIGFAVALMSIFTLLAIPLRSYGQAIIIMLVIPFGYVGAVLGHLFLDLQMSFLSMTGVMACAGVVVNDSLVLVTFLNRLRAEGMPLLEAATKAGQTRFRAILLTSLTTFAGLTPIMLDRSTQAQFVIPMAVSLAFGVMVATGFTLLLIPAAVVIADDLKLAGPAALRRAGAWLAGRAPDAPRPRSIRDELR